METKDSESKDVGSEWVGGDRPSKILLVDDEPSNRSLLRDILGNSGYEIVEADNGRVALEIAAAESPDTVLLDVMMPEMDGFETCSLFKQDETLAAIPIIFVTARTDVEDLAR